MKLEMSPLFYIYKRNNLDMGPSLRRLCHLTSGFQRGRMYFFYAQEVHP